MAEWFASGRIVDAILGLVAVEAVALLVLRRWTGRGPAPIALLSNLASGAALMLALRAALVQAAWPVVAGWMLAALGAHLGDLLPRLLPRPRARDDLTLGRTGAGAGPGTSHKTAAFNARLRS